MLTPAMVTNPGSAARAPVTAPGNEKLDKSAREFEAILLQSWLEKMNQSFIGESESQDAAHDTISSLGSEAIATALAARGGIGIASMLMRQLRPPTEAKAELSSEAPQNQSVNPHIASGR